MEAADAGTRQDIEELRRTLPVPIDYVAIFATSNDIADATAQGLESSGARMVSSAGNPVFLRIYKLPKIGPVKLERRSAAMNLLAVRRDAPGS